MGWAYVSWACLAAAVILSWRSETLRPVGVALVVSCVASNLVQLYFAMDERPPAYTVLEVGVMSMAFVAHACGASRLTIAVVAVSVVSILANFYISLLPNLSHNQIGAWEAATNLCFMLECLLTAGAGIRERLGSHRWTASWGRSDPLHGSAAHRAEAER